MIFTLSSKKTSNLSASHFHLKKCHSWHNCPTWLNSFSVFFHSLVYVDWVFNYESYEVRGGLPSVARKRKTDLTTFISYETKVHLQENQSFLFFKKKSSEKTLCFLWEVLRGICTLSATFWSHKQDQTTYCKALNVVKEKLLLSYSGSSPGRRRDLACLFYFCN